MRPCLRDPGSVCATPPQYPRAGIPIVAPPQRRHLRCYGVNIQVPSRIELELPRACLFCTSTNGEALGSTAFDGDGGGGYVRAPKVSCEKRQWVMNESGDQSPTCDERHALACFLPFPVHTGVIASLGRGADYCTPDGHAQGNRMDRPW